MYLQSLNFPPKAKIHMSTNVKFSVNSLVYVFIFYLFGIDVIIVTSVC